jgi:hypothetical protein
MAAISAKGLLSVLFLATACVAYFTMLHLLGAPHTPHGRTLRIIHRLSGGISVALYIITSVACIAAWRSGADLSPRTAIHLTFGALFIPFIVLKVVIVEKYPELRNRLFGIGTVLLAVVFVLFFTSVTTLMGRGEEPRPGEELSANAEAISLGRDLFVVKCAKCHRLDRALSTRKTPDRWRQTVEQMRQKDMTWLSEHEADMIARFLISIGGNARSD